MTRLFWCLPAAMALFFVAELVLRRAPADGCVLRVDDAYMRWYRAAPGASVLVARSRDGVAWEPPSASDLRPEARDICVCFDAHADEPALRYRAWYWRDGQRWVASSVDGRAWSDSAPLADEAQCDACIA